LEINGTHQILVSNGDVNKLGGSIHTIKKCRESLVVVRRMD
jgi:hypothetical protein